MLLFDEDFDCLIWEDSVVMPIGGLIPRAIFDLYDELSGRGSRLVDAVVELIEDPEELREEWRDGKCLREAVCGVAAAPYIARLTMDDVKRTIARHGISRSHCCGCRR